MNPIVVLFYFATFSSFEAFTNLLSTFPHFLPTFLFISSMQQFGEFATVMKLVLCYSCFYVNRITDKTLDNVLFVYGKTK